MVHTYKSTIQKAMRQHRSEIVMDGVVMDVSRYNRDVKLLLYLKY